MSVGQSAPGGARTPRLPPLQARELLGGGAQRAAHRWSRRSARLCTAARLAEARLSQGADAQAGADGSATTGALEVWEQDHDVPIGTAPDAGIWHSLLYEEAHNARNPRPYTWVTVTENTKPELLKVHENNKVVITSPTNTGIPDARPRPAITRSTSASPRRRCQDQPGRDALQRSRCPVGQLLQRRRCRARVHTPSLWVPAEPRLRRAADHDGGEGLLQADGR